MLSENRILNSHENVWGKRRMFRRVLVQRCAPSHHHSQTAAQAIGDHRSSLPNEAMKVKQHCTIALSKYANVPPDVFVHRAYAYLALNQPYFAMADFGAASQFLNLGDEPMNICQQQLQQLPAEMVATFKASHRHLSHVINQYLSEKVQVETINDNVGRGLVAKTVIAAGETIVKRTQPWLAYPLLEERCSHCCAPFGIRRFACQNNDCHEEYCSRDCRQFALEKYHREVCTNRAFQGLELEVYAKMKNAASPSARNEVAIHLLLLRVIAASCAHRVIPSALPELQSLAGRITFTPKVVATELLDFHRRLTSVTHTVTTISYEEMFCALAKIAANVFQDDDKIYVNLPCSMMNHSCSPNAAGTGGDTIAVQTIHPGEEICISYFPHLSKIADKGQRKLELERRSFDCWCKVCQVGKG